MQKNKKFLDACKSKQFIKLMQATNVEYKPPQYRDLVAYLGHKAETQGKSRRGSRDKLALQ